MRILVINGSPKGKNSITLQTVNYLQLLHKEHNFEVLHAGQMIKQLEKDFTYNMMERIDDSHCCVRFCTSWATKQEDMDALCAALVKYSK